MCELLETYILLSVHLAPSTGLGKDQGLSGCPIEGLGLLKVGPGGTSELSSLGRTHSGPRTGETKYDGVSPWGLPGVSDVGWRQRRDQFSLPESVLIIYCPVPHKPCSSRLRDDKPRR